MEYIVSQRFPIINTPLCHHEIKNLSPAVYDEMELDPVKPAKRTLAFLSFSRFIWQGLNGVGSIDEMPVHRPKQSVFSIIAITATDFCYSSTKQLYETSCRKYSFMYRHT